jgi:hypothetical protein
VAAVLNRESRETRVWARRRDLLPFFFSSLQFWGSHFASTRWSHHQPSIPDKSRETRPSATNGRLRALFSTASFGGHTFWDLGKDRRDRHPKLCALTMCLPTRSGLAQASELVVAVAAEPLMGYQKARRRAMRNPAAPCSADATRLADCGS